MLSTSDREVAQTFKARVRRVAPVRSVRVYGSRARGDAVRDSDLDAYIELERVTPALRQQISEIAWEVGFANEIVISTFVVSREQLESGPIGASPIVANVMREGVLIEDEELDEEESGVVEENAFARILALATDLGVSDLAEQHDHYLYGLEKR